MASNKKPTDELLAALPDVGLALWMLDQIGDKWHAAIHNPQDPIGSRQDGEGTTPAAALIAALQAAGIEVTDE